MLVIEEIFFGKIGMIIWIICSRINIIIVYLLNFWINVCKEVFE